jgi:hypothetical protein
MGIGYSKKKRSYGWKKDDHDERDLIITFHKKELRSIPTKIDLRNSFNRIYDQLELDSCNANAICSLFPGDPSRLFLYFNEKSRKTGSIRDSIKSAIKFGVCDEVLWPYDTTKFDTAPGDFETHFYNIKYKRIPKKIEYLKATLAKGYPFVFGFNVYESFEQCSSEYVPNKETEKLLGGHCVCAIGYSDKKQSFLIKNSMGKNWGSDGYFLISYDFILSNDCSDFWMFEHIKEVSYQEKESEAPTKDSPTKDTPTKDAPTKDEPPKDAPTKDAPPKEAPTKDAPTKDSPTDEAYSYQGYSSEEFPMSHKKYIEKKRNKDRKNKNFLIREDI